MTRPGWRGSAFRSTIFLLLTLLISSGVTGSARVDGEDTGLVDPSSTGLAVVRGAPTVQLPLEIQVVRFSAPSGVGIEVMDPPALPIPTILSPEEAKADESSLTVGLQVGVGYRLRLTSPPNQPETTVYPVIEVVGHLHRPTEVDPAEFPIRVSFSIDDFNDVIDYGQLVTKVTYLESPDQALPISVPENEVPTVRLSPGEDPVRVAERLGRLMVISRIGGRKPVPGEPIGFGDLGLTTGPCPFQHPESGVHQCSVPVCPPIGPGRPPKPLFPTDEYLCDGGDHGTRAGVAPGGIAGVEPSDALIRFRAGDKPRVLPTNTVCIYAPRFAAVRIAQGPIQTRFVATPRGAVRLSRMEESAAVLEPNRLDEYLAPGALRVRSRASELERLQGPNSHIEVRVLNGFSTIAGLVSEELIQGPAFEGLTAPPLTIQEENGPLAIQTAGGVTVTGIIQGANETRTTFVPAEIAGVEEPPSRPGVAVFKETDTKVAKPGTEVTFKIHYRNMGNVLIESVSIVDSLLPRLEYIEDSSEGPAGTVFTAKPNSGGSTELRWDLPGSLEPGEQGSVTFRARVR